MRAKVSTDSLVLVAICLLDMFSTLFFVLKGIGVEQNPIMAVCMNHSPLTFVLVKLASFVPFVIAVELYRRKDPVFARFACRCAIVLYLVTFTVLTLKTNLV